MDSANEDDGQRDAQTWLLDARLRILLVEMSMDSRSRSRVECLQDDGWWLVSLVCTVTGTARLDFVDTLLLPTSNITFERRRAFKRSSSSAVSLK